MSSQKYSDKQYLDMEYFGGDEVTNQEYKIVTTRKEHECVTIHKDPHPIPVGSRALREKAIHVDDGRDSCYLCLDCCNDYLEEIYDEDDLEKFEDK